VCAGYGGGGSQQQYRTRSSRGFEPIDEELSVGGGGDPFIARAQSNWRGATPPSDRGSQVSHQR